MTILLKCVRDFGAGTCYQALCYPMVDKGKTMVKHMQGKERQDIKLSVGIVETMAKQIIYHNSL
eukprot:6920977-Prorocentrum_lima.AAC.1